MPSIFYKPPTFTGVGRDREVKGIQRMVEGSREFCERVGIKEGGIDGVIREGLGMVSCERLG